jgi:hypothetical protein
VGTLINILGAERTGSTMLDVMLGNGDGCFSCGEVSFWFRPMRKHNYILDCSCGESNCEIWAKLKNLKEEEFHEFLLLKYQFVIDSSKNLVWIIDNYCRINSKFQIINLVIYKDIENVIYSHWKRNNDIKVFFKRYFQYYKELLQTGLPFYTVKYEDLANDPSKILESICEKTGMNYFKGKEDFWLGEHHFLFGSHGIRQQLRKSQSFIYKAEKKNDGFYNYLKENEESLFKSVHNFKHVENILEINDINNIKDIVPLHRESLHKPYWYYIKKIGRAIKRYFPDDYQIKDVNPIYGKK